MVHMLKNKMDVHLIIVEGYFVRYENTPVQYIAIFYGCKNGNFQMKYLKNCDFLLFFA